MIETLSAVQVIATLVATLLTIALTLVKLVQRLNDE
jgi:hypothetical protein